MAVRLGALALTAVGALAGPIGTASAQVVNGSFESPDVPTGTFGIFPSIPGWSHEPAPQAASSSGIEIQDNVAGAPAPGAGDQFVELDSDGPSRIFQDVATNVGSTYRLAFLYSPRPGTVADQNHFTVSAGPASAEIGPLASAATTIWQPFTLDFVANSSSSRIEYLDLGPEESAGGLGAYIDVVTVELVSAPGECSDGIDNDGDGKIDFGPNPNHNDPNCHSADDNSETPECRDHIDNDGDGKIDFSRNRFHKDPQCKSPDDDNEAV
jgi:hypothetical protein